MSKTYVVNARYSLEDIATIAAFLERHGVRVRTRSEAPQQGVKMAAEIIRQNHPSLSFDIKQAYDFMLGLGIDPMRSNRGSKNLIEALQHHSLEGYITTETTSPEPKKIAKPASKEVPNDLISSEELSAAKKRRDKELLDKINSFKSVSGIEMED